jgi:hypothetical protein
LIDEKVLIEYLEEGRMMRKGDKMGKRDGIVMYEV